MANLTQQINKLLINQVVSRYTMNNLNGISYIYTYVRVFMIHIYVHFLNKVLEKSCGESIGVFVLVLHSATAVASTND